LFDLKTYSIKYCQNDVILTKKVLSKIFNIIDEENKNIRKKSLSAPSISHKLFYKKYNNENIEENLGIEYDNYVRSAYFGGRCEVFGNLKNNEYIKYFDFSGMYGQCMLEFFHCGLKAYEKPLNIDKPGFYNVEYESRDNYLPILPCHDNNNKLIFANGTRSGTF